MLRVYRSCCCIFFFMILRVSSSISEGYLIPFSCLVPSYASDQLCSPGFSTRLRMIFFDFGLKILFPGDMTLNFEKVRPKFLSSVLSFSAKSSEAPLFCLSTMTYLLLRLVLSPSPTLSILPRASVPKPIRKL